MADFYSSLSAIDRLIWDADTPDKQRRLAEQIAASTDLQEQMFQCAEDTFVDALSRKLCSEIADALQDG